MTRLGTGLAQLLVLAAAAPLCRGLSARLRARLQRRRGAPVWRPYAELAKLFRKEDLAPPTASPVFLAAPRLMFLATCAAAAVLPVWHSQTLVQAPADFFLLAGALALGRLLLSLGALDGGSAFGGMGAAREALVGTLAEGPSLLALSAVALLSGQSSLSAMADWTLRQPWQQFSAVSMLALASLAMVMLAETGRMPVDNPTSHLELTMIHEAMTLEYSGPSLAWVEWASALRLLIYLTLLVDVFFPWGLAGAGGWGAAAAAAGWFGVKIAGLLAALAVIEASLAKLRMYAVPGYLGVATALGALAIVLGAFGG